MKILKWIAAAICITFAAFCVIGFGVNMYEIYRIPESHVEITGAIVDNDYNNFISEYDLVNDTGDLVRIGDKLYCNYWGSYASYGLYEITSDGAKRIHWDGNGPWSFLIGHWYKLYPIQAYNGKLLMNTIIDRNSEVYFIYNTELKDWELAQGRMQTYCEETQTFEEAQLFGGVTQIHALTYQKTSFGYVYESSKRFDLWVYTKDGSESIGSEPVLSFYTVGEQIYYMTTTPDGPYILRAFDWGQKTDTVICELEGLSGLSYFMVDGNNLIFEATHPASNTQSVYLLDLSNPLQKETAIFTIDQSIADSTYISSWNVWNGTAYLCTQNGLIALDLDTGEHHVLCDKGTLECDIVDDTWVYFMESGNHALWRVPQSGGKAELVLG